MICGIALPLTAREITLRISDLKYYIKIEKNSTLYMSPKQTEQINKKEKT